MNPTPTMRQCTGIAAIGLALLLCAPAAPQKVEPRPGRKAAASKAAEPAAKFVVPENTHSPNGRYAVTVPVYDPDAAEKSEEPGNKLIERRTGKVLAIIRGDTGYDRPLNHHETLPARWSSDGTLLLWEIAGKWCPDGLTLLKLEKGQVAWQRDLLKLAQQAILTRTHSAVPQKYAAAKKANAGNGAAYPDGFTINVEVPGPVSLPLWVSASLTSDPKGAMPETPLVESHLEAITDKDGKFKVMDFGLGPAKE